MEELDQGPGARGYRCGTAGLWIDEERFPSIARGQAHALAVLQKARHGLAQQTGHRSHALASIVLGSVGRGEASAQSDLDVAFVYDQRHLPLARAETLRRSCMTILRQDFDVPEKTFVRPIEIQELCRKIGGMYDTNEQLTYRALMLTEGQWLHHSEMAATFNEQIFAAYTRPQTSRGKFLSCLANDLHRYYRTLCVDYRFKVEEQAKPWAIRALKLRYSRKLWHLSNLALQCWFVDQFQEEGSSQGRVLLERLNERPLDKLGLAAHYFECETLLEPLLSAYEFYLLHLSDKATRSELRSLEYGGRKKNEIYMALRDNADRFDEVCADWFDVLMKHCRSYLLRYCVF